MDREGKVQSINNYNTWRRKILIWDNSPAILTNIDSLKNRVSGDWGMNAFFSVQKYFHVTCLQRTRTLREREREIRQNIRNLWLKTLGEKAFQNIQKLMMKEHYCEAPLGWRGSLQKVPWCVSLYKKRVEGKRR